MDIVIKEVLDLYSKAKDRWHDAIKDSMLCFKFAIGDQWSSEEKKYLRHTGRPDNVVYNKILPRLNNLIGIEQQNRRSIIVKPASEEYDDLSELLQQLFISIQNDSELEYIISQTFKTGLITPIPAWIEIGTKLNNNAEKEYTFKLANSYMITPDPTFKDYFLRDCDWIIKESWMTAEDIKEKYDKKIDPVDKSWWNSLLNVDEIYSVWNKTYPQNEYYDKSENKFKVLELQKKVLVKEYVFMEIATEKYSNVREDESKNLFKNKEYVFVSEMMQKRMNIKAIVPYVDMTLQDELSDLNTDMFDVIPYMSFDYNHIKTESDSFVKSLIPIQKSYNKREVQYLAFLDHSISAPVFFHHSDKETKEQYDKIGNKPNASFVYKSSKTIPFRLQPNQVPYSIKEKLNDDEENMNDISAINDSMRGKSEYSEESGRLFNMKNQVAGVTSNHYFNNLSKTRKMIGEYILHTIGQVYGEPNRIATIMNNKGESKEVILNMDMGDGNIINDINSFNGKIAVDEGQKSVTYREEKFMQKMALVNLFGMELINPEWLLKDSELPDWEEQVEYMQMVMGIQTDNASREQALNEDGQVLEQLAQEKALQEDGGQSE